MSQILIVSLHSCQCEFRLVFSIGIIQLMYHYSLERGFGYVFIVLSNSLLEEYLRTKNFRKLSGRNIPCVS